MENITEVTKDVVTEPVVEETPKFVYGELLNCEKLNVRKEPNKEADVAFVLDSKTTFMIDESASTEDWFCIYSADELCMGFCMKKFVAVTKR